MSISIWWISQVLVWWKARRHQDNADLQRTVESGCGDTPVIRLRYRCGNCPDVHGSVAAYSNTS
jgi:hypothetical protein